MNGPRVTTAARRLGWGLLLLGWAALWAGCDDAVPAEDAADDAAAGDAAAAPTVDVGVDAGADAAADAGRPALDGGPVDAAPDAATSTDAMVDAAAIDPVERPLAAQGPYGPAARISLLDMPATPDAARRAGCLLLGPGAGTKLYSVLLLAGGGLGPQVRPNPAGRIELVVLLRARGWAEGVSAAALDAIDIDVAPGAQDDALALHYRRDAFEGDDPANPARTVFPATFVDDGWLDSDLVDFTIPLSLLGSPQVPLTLTGTRITGRVAAEGAGWRLSSGAIAGYFTLTELRRLIEEVQRFCGDERPPSICALVGDQVEMPVDALTETIVGFLDGLEVRVEDGRVGACDPAAPDDCNAVGVCLRVEASPVEVVGVTAP